MTLVIRPTWDIYFIRIAELAASRSTCLRRQVGAVIVRDNQILATGYNGVPRGVSHCTETLKSTGDWEFEVTDTTCIRSKLNIPSGQKQELCRGLHAEQNCIVQAARHGMSIKDSVIYCNYRPCLICLKMIINSGIKEVIYKEDYDDPMSLEMAREAQITLRKL